MAAIEEDVTPRKAQMFMREPLAVTNQMSALLRKAGSLINEDNIPSRLVPVDRMKELIGIGKSGVAILSDAERKEINSSIDVEKLLEEVNAAICQADDLLDECAYHIQNHPRSRSGDKESRCKVPNYLLKILCLCGSNMDKRFKSMNLNLKTALKKGKDFSSVPYGASNEGSGAMQDSSENELQVVQDNEKNGIANVVEKLVRSDNDKDLSFISLVGWGATGKTTVARLVYKDVTVMSHFDERMWVQVSVDFDVDKIAKSMLTSLTRTRVEVSQIETISRRLQERLKGKIYLLVLDEVWEEDRRRLDLLIKFLRDLGGSRGCKVVITTCIQLPTPSEVQSLEHKMSLETSAYCRALFDKISSTDEGAFGTQDLKNIAETFVKECRGNPLYIKLLGSLMHRMKDKSWWETIEKSKRWEDLSHGIPQLCFDYMTSLSLKQCLQYCSIFPKGYLFWRGELIQLWMALGYLNPPEGIDQGVSYHSKIEDQGDQYYDMLLKSSFLQAAVDDDFDGESCKIHELLRGMVLFTESGDCFKTLEERDIRDGFRAVHLSLINCKLEFTKALRDSFANLRTLRLENTGDLGDSLACAKGLRVLIVVDGSIEELPNSIGMLTRLKYLDISRTEIVRLPDSISKLYNLQTLRLYDLHESPMNFENLQNLRYFYIQNFNDSAKVNTLPPKFRGLVNLSSMKASVKVFLDNECKIDKLELLGRPHSVSIHQLENVTNPEEATKARLSTKDGIKSLKLHWSARRENSYDEEVLRGLEPHPSVKILVIENFKGTRFPSWMEKLLKLVKMELENCSWCEQLPPLGHLPHLRILKIVGMNNVHRIAEEFYGFKGFEGESSSHSSSSRSPVFPALKEFTLFGMSNLKEWSGSIPSSTGAFHCLERFEVEQCPNLISIPDVVLQRGHQRLLKLRVAVCENLTLLPKGLGKLESLESLDIIGLPSLQPLCFGYIKNLKSLTVGCFSTASSDDHCHEQHTTSLHLQGTSTDVKHLPEQLQQLSALTNLTIWGYSQLDSLPEWLANLRSLQILKLELCGELKYFPPAEKMQQLTNLKELNICYCPLLEERCTRGSRPEWHKVSRIPTIVLNHETIHQLRRSPV